MKDEIAIEVGQRIRSIRVALGLTLEQVGARVGMTKGQVGKIEQGAPRTSPGHYSAIAKALGVEHADLYRKSPWSRLSQTPTTSRKSLIGKGSRARSRGVHARKVSRKATRE